MRGRSAGRGAGECGKGIGGATAEVDLARATRVAGKGLEHGRTFSAHRAWSVDEEMQSM